MMRYNVLKWDIPKGFGDRRGRMRIWRESMSMKGMKRIRESAGKKPGFLRGRVGNTLYIHVSW